MEAGSLVLVERDLQVPWASGNFGEQLGVRCRGQTGGGKAEVGSWGVLPQDPVEEESGRGGFSTTASSSPALPGTDTRFPYEFQRIPQASLLRGRRPACGIEGGLLGLICA